MQALLGPLQQRATVLLIGEAGMGKTRLIEAVAQRQRAQSALVVSARPGDQAVPYALARRWLRALASHGGLPAEARTRAALARLLPEWADGAAGAAPPTPADVAARIRAAASAGAGGAAPSAHSGRRRARAARVLASAGNPPCDASARSQRLARA